MKLKQCLLALMVFLSLLGCNSDKESAQSGQSYITTTSTHSSGISSELPISTFYTGLIKPESIILLNREVYISNLGNELGQGFVSQSGSARVRNLNAPKGMALLNDQLALLVDQAEVHMLYLVPPEPEIIISNIIVGAKNLNDIIALSDSVFLVSDTETGVVHRVNVDGDDFEQSIFIDADKLNGNGINGLAYDEGREMLYIITSKFGGNEAQGHVYQVPLNNTNYQISGEIEQWNAEILGNGNLDGIAIKDNQLFISDWETIEGNPAAIYIFDIDLKEKTHTISGNFSSPADIAIDEIHNLLYVPEQNKNIVSAIELSSM